MLIHTFLSQAISPYFPTNTLYKWHVLEDRDLPDPGRPPYNSSAVFAHVKRVKETTPLNVAWVTVRQWYQLLLEMFVTHTSQNVDLPPILLSSKLEDRHPGVELSSSYHMSRIIGLS